MAAEGIYEQIVNRKLRQVLQTLDREQFDVKLESLTADDARKVLTIYIASVIQKGLRYVRESYHTDEDADALLAQIRLCNDIIEEIVLHTNEADFAQMAIEEKGEVLTSLYRKINSARAVSGQKPVRPQTSLMESTLFTGAKQEPSMLSEIKKEIISCDRVDLLVSFVKWSAVRRIMPELREFTARPGVSLRILTTTYMKATDCKAIEELARLPNTEIKVNYETDHMRMHAKSYLFHRDTGFSTAYIGSSNLSNAALTDGLEWNMKVTERDSFDVIRKFAVTFESYWNDASFETFRPDDPACTKKLRMELGKIIPLNGSGFHLQCSVRPYPYQQEILDTLQAEREVYGFRKNLVVGSTGVGKTLVAAFDYKRYLRTHPNATLLFVAHRKEILEQSRQKFREVLNDFNFGDCYFDGQRPGQIRQLFISIQSFNAADFVRMTTPDHYDFIVVDEFHHAAARSYRNLLEYYTPDILLGLTATPERMDGKSVVDEWFGGRIAAELRLPEAIDRKLLCPFQYFGVTDDVDYSKLTWKGKYDISELEQVYTADTKRADLILKSVQRYITDIDEVKGLGFCVSVAHAEYMAAYFTKCGIPSEALSAKSKDVLREDAKRKLVEGELRFLFVVDLYNEGVDIPELNTVLFLRPTESATVFLQQLGRGLRLYPGKDCLTVLDFVGQQHRKYNFEIKLRAMTGRTREPMRHYVEEGFSSLPRGCYIYLEKQAREYVLRNLKECLFDKRGLIGRAATFEADTGKPLNLENFLDYYQIPVTDFYQANGGRSMHRLRQWAGLTEDTRDADDSIWRALTGLLHVNSAKLLDYWCGWLEKPKAPVSENDRLMLNMLYYTFYKKAPAKQGFSSVAEGIQSLLREDFVREEVLELLRYNRGRLRFVAVPNDYGFVCPLELHCRYSTRQVLAALGFYNETEAPEFREGVKYLQDRKTDIFFINLNKSEKEFSPSTMYDDYAISSTLFHWQSQSTAAEDSATAQRYIHHRENGGNISLFVREFKKNGSYTAPYMFLGNADYVNHFGSKPVSFTWRLHREIPAEILPKANKSAVI